MMSSATSFCLRSWGIRNFCTGRDLCGKYLTNSHKALRVSPRIVSKMIRAEQERVKKVQDTKRESKKPSEVIMEDRHKVANFCRVFKDTLSLAVCHSPIREKIVGRGVNITKVKIGVGFREVQVYWVTTQPEREQETACALNDSAADVRSLMQDMCNLGKMPRIVFVKDLEYLKEVVLEAEFKKIKALDLDDADSKAVTSTATNEAMPLSESTFTKRKDVLRLDRQEILKQVEDQRIRCTASHRVSRKLGPDDPLPQFAYMTSGREDETSAVKNVRVFLAERKKQAANAEKILQRAVQPQEMS